MRNCCVTIAGYFSFTDQVVCGKSPITSLGKVIGILWFYDRTKFINVSTLLIQKAELIGSKLKEDEESAVLGVA